MFSSLLTSLESLRIHTARFRRVAVHLHSPDSHDWGKGGNPVRNDRSRFDGDSGLGEFANELRAHLDFVCVTDHMKCTLASKLSRGNHGLTILPGMEVNIRLDPFEFGRIHVLTILPEGSGPESFACLFVNQPDINKDDAQRKGQEQVIGLTLKQWVDLVHGEKGICIAAHIDNKNGVRLAFRQAAKDVIRLLSKEASTQAEQEHDVPDTLKNYLFDSGLDAIEVRSSADGQHYRWTSKVDGRTRSIATLLTFDAHCCEEFGRRDRINHVKMTSLGITGLRNAIRFPDTRIRFPHNLPSASCPRLLGISIKGEDDSFFKDVTIALAENLNCIIGVRGSGKSTIIEALRYVFGYNRTLNELGPMADGIREMQRANLKGSIIRVAYRTRSGEDRILQATFDAKADYDTKCFKVDGDYLEVADVEACGDYPLRLFGWSEIETLGRSPTRQRDLLDRLIPEIVQVIRKRDSLRRDLATNRGVIGKCLSDLQAAWNRSNNHIVHFREYSSDFEKLNTDAVKTLFGSLDLAKAKRRLLVKILDNTDASIEQFQSFANFSVRADVDQLLSEGSDALRDWWVNNELNAADVVTVETDVSGLCKQIIERLVAFRASIATRIASLDKEIETIEKGLQQSLDQSGDDSMQRIADLRANAERRLNAVAETRRLYQQAWTAFHRALDERDVLCDRLLSLQDEIAGIRIRHNQDVETTLNRFLPDWMEVSIQFRAGQDKAEYKEKLRDVVPGRANKASVVRVRAILEQHLNPVLAARTILKDSFADLAGKSALVDGERITLSNDDIEEWASKIRLFEQNEFADVQTLAEGGSRLTKVLDLQEVAWDDFVTILLDGGPVNEKSPGQRASAMLPLIALAEEAPLVIDQPEDNLDKRLVGSVLMQVLAELKEKRQITVCTHDPNILVGGDAEQVIVLKAENHRRGVVELHGSIDNERIVQTVIDLLEGGEEAFEARKRRYGLDGENVTI